MPSTRTLLPPARNRLVPPRPDTTDASAAKVRAVVAAQEAAQTARFALAEAGDQSRGSRALLASRLRDAGEVVFGSITALCFAVEYATGTPRKSVWNALYSTFGEDILTRCVEVLVNASIAPGGDGDNRAAVRAETDAVRDARDKAREARKDLAGEILSARREFFPTLDAFTTVVAGRLGLSPRTVRNALRDTFSADVLATCVDLLEEARTGSNRAAVRAEAAPPVPAA